MAQQSLQAPCWPGWTSCAEAGERAVRCRVAQGGGGGQGDMAIRPAFVYQDRNTGSAVAVPVERTGAGSPPRPVSLPGLRSTVRTLWVQSQHMLGPAQLPVDRRQDRVASRHKKGVGCVRANACDLCGVCMCHSSSGQQQMAVESGLLWAKRRQRSCARFAGIVRCGAASCQRRSRCAAVGQCGRNSGLRCRAGSHEALERTGGEQLLPLVPDYQDRDRRSPHRPSLSSQ